MKKIASLIGAAALMFASTGVAFGAFVWNDQFASQHTGSLAVSNTGLNRSGGIFSSQFTGPAFSASGAKSDANGTKITASGPAFVGNDQTAFQHTGSLAVSNTGLNASGGVMSHQSTGAAFSASGSESWANYSTITIK